MYFTKSEYILKKNVFQHLFQDKFKYFGINTNRKTLTPFIVTRSKSYIFSYK